MTVSWWLALSVVAGATIAPAYSLPPADQLNEDPLSANVIVIEGVRREFQRSHRAGQSLVMRHTDETRFEAKSLLKNEANLSLPDTGKTTASGFTVPRVRGQDARLTEVFIEGLRVQDPYAGYPVIDDLDLRACGEMAIYVGTTPPALPTVNSNGVLAYRLVERQHRPRQVGLTVGKPYGTAAWALFHRDASDDHSAPKRVRIYAREHWTRGEFSYYDDNLTPYNAADDRYSTRRHADRHARQVLPSFAWAQGAHRLTGVSLWNDSQSSVPARMSGVDSQAREHDSHRLGRFAYRYQFDTQNPFVPYQAGVEVGIYDDDLELKDPTGAVLGFVQTNRRQLDSRLAAANITWQTMPADRPASLYLRGETQQTQIKATSGVVVDYRLQRRQQTLYAGAEVPIPRNLLIELKSQISGQEDALDQGDALRTAMVPRDADRNGILRGSSVAAAWQSGVWNLYAQLARNERGPTLLEGFGDGALVRDNPGLRPERLLHREVGSQWRKSELHRLVRALAFRSAIFQSDSRDRIVLLPSVGQTLRAQNISDTQIRGFEVGGEATLDRYTMTLGYAHLIPRDQSIAGRIRQIPGVPTDVATGSLTLNLTPCTLRWATRYQSQVWRDSENAIAVPGYLIHDATIDTQYSRFALGVAVYNVANRQKSEIRAVETKANRGYTSYGDYAGMPLPGRQLRLSLSAEM